MFHLLLALRQPIVVTSAFKDVAQRFGHKELGGLHPSRAERNLIILGHVFISSTVGEIHPRHC